VRARWRWCDARAREADAFGRCVVCVRNDIASHSTMATFSAPVNLLKPETALHDGRFIVSAQKLGRGQFAEVYAASDGAHPSGQANARVAIKIESEPRTTAREGRVMRALSGKKHFLELLCEGSHEGKPFLAMDLVGENLADVRARRPGGRFTARTVSAIAVAMLEALESMHELGYVHRDIKPGNVCIGNGREGIREFYLIDFGLARKYVDDDGKVIPERKDTTFRGTTTYASVYAHEGKEQSARDDLFSTLYIIVESIEGVLPWKAGERSLTKPEVEKMKKECLRNPQKLCPTMRCPPAVETFARVIRTLKYGEKPNYAALKAPFEQVIRDAGDAGLDWESSAVAATVAAATTTPESQHASRTTAPPMPDGPPPPVASYAEVASNGGNVTGNKRQREDEPNVPDDGRPAPPPPPPLAPPRGTLVNLAHDSPSSIPPRLADIVRDVAHRSTFEEALAVASGLVSYVAENTLRREKDFPCDPVRASVSDLKEICFRIVGQIDKTFGGPGRRGVAPPRRDFGGGGANRGGGGNFGNHGHNRRGPGDDGPGGDQRRGPGGDGKHRRRN